MNLVCAMDKQSGSGPLMKTHIDVPIGETRVANIYGVPILRTGV
jgi:hypothetical protein